MMKKEIELKENIEEEISTEAARIARWINTKSPENVDLFIFHLLMKSNLNYFEVLGLLEHLKSNVYDIVNNGFDEEDEN